MAFNINNFKAAGLTGGGARPSLFQVQLTPPAGVFDASQKLTFTCRASSIPASTVAPVEVPYFGRKIKLAGDRTFADWNVTVMNDEDYNVRAMFEEWSQRLNTNETNLKTIQNNDYKTVDAVVQQFGKIGESKVIAQYNFYGLFPLEISAMELDWDSTNQIQTFNVTFAYDYWISLRQLGAQAPSVNPGAGTGGGFIPSRGGEVVQ
jgi:hypothetical protein